MSERDDLLPVFEEIPSILEEFGLSRFRVIRVIRTWDGGMVGEGIPSDDEMEIRPRPEVVPGSNTIGDRQDNTSAGTRDAATISVVSIVPKHSAGGYTPAELVPSLGQADSKELFYKVIGDGITRECTVVRQWFDDAFEYKLLLRPRNTTPASAG